jgi:hypothetical protein
MIPYLVILNKNTAVKLEFTQTPTKEDLKKLAQKLEQDLLKYPREDLCAPDSHPKAD